MTKDEKRTQVMLSLSLGPIFPVFGVIEQKHILTCECGRSDCAENNKGKHPRFRNWAQTATLDPAQLDKWLEKWPDGNFAVVTGLTAIAVDLDIRNNRNGVEELEYIEIDVGQRIPYTVTVNTGRQNGSDHLYFELPDKLIQNRIGPVRGIDVKALGGYCIAPGSRHMSGGYYKFAEELSPDEIQLSKMPAFLIAALTENCFKVPHIGAETLHSELLATEGGLSTGPLKPLPDSRVLYMILRDRVARFYWYGGRTSKQSRSEDDFALACKLSFYCQQNLDQMYRLFLQSGLCRKKFFEKRDSYNYALLTLRRAIDHSPKLWEPTPRVRKPKTKGSKRGRKITEQTHVVLAAYDKDQARSKQSIANELGLSVSKVRDTIRYHRRMGAENPCRQIHTYLSSQL